MKIFIKFDWPVGKEGRESTDEASTRIYGIISTWAYSLSKIYRVHKFGSHMLIPVRPMDIHQIRVKSS